MGDVVQVRTSPKPQAQQVEFSVHGALVVSWQHVPASIAGMWIR